MRSRARWNANLIKLALIFVSDASKIKHEHTQYHNRRHYYCSFYHSCHHLSSSSYVLDASKTSSEHNHQSYTSKGIWRHGDRLFCKKFLCFNTMPCRHMPLLVHFWNHHSVASLCAVLSEAPFGSIQLTVCLRQHYYTIVLSKRNIFTTSDYKLILRNQNHIT